MKDTIIELSQVQKQDLVELSKYIYDNPELGNEEFKSSKAVADYLSKNGFQIEMPLCDIETAFLATFDSGKEGPTIAYLCEYDALPGIGHGCGHNMIATMSAGAGVVISKVINELGGKVLVFGTPAEETNGAKVPLTEAGYFDNVDAVMMVHPSNVTRESGTSLAIVPLEFKYTGQTAHAAACPEKGINALNAVISLFNGIDAMRQHVTDDVRMHGVITNGGEAANVVPGEAVTRWYFRASTKEVLAPVLEKVENIAKGAALITGATLEMSQYELAYDDLKTNANLSELFNANLKDLGITDMIPAGGPGGSVDIGNISNVTATIHPYIAIGSQELISHTVEMACATQTEYGNERMMIAIQALAMTGVDVLQGKFQK